MSLENNVKRSYDLFVPKWMSSLYIVNILDECVVNNSGGGPVGKSVKDGKYIKPITINIEAIDDFKG